MVPGPNLLDVRAVTAIHAGRTREHGALVEDGDRRRKKA
jgi:hypothetical protein